ncbi:hypothetical protein DFH08DRAFT_1085128 [Mycena albidolilacea]|uniref:Uncharacterized protein n=1 Tax=Mycena albidolilacea TaxID=1033008 RepID=A0AAD7EH89_9AGAR|nr:hypothetical protein DFH08DRAFT_1085128 [Mycena albidolilacea]
MSFTHFRSTSSQLHPDRDENVPMRDRDSAESLLHSAVELLKISREAPKPRWFNSSEAFQVLSLVLHSLLVEIHLALLAIWAKGLVHRIVFSLDNQKTVNFRITAIANTFGAIYAAALVFVTQRLWTRQSLRADQTLTATHDSAAAWTGIGSALSQLWSQRTMSGSVIGVLSVFLYLANILVLHITTPALFSFETFNLTWPVPVETRSLPSLDSFSQVNWSDPDNAFHAIWGLVLSDYVKGSLYFLPSILGSNTSLGLKDGTLYDVVDINSGVGNVTVDATGFDITCRYMTDVNITHQQSTKDWPEYWIVDFDGPMAYLYPTQRGIIYYLESGLISPRGFSNYVDFCTTTPTMDSNNYLPPEVKLDPPMNTFADPVSSLQVFRCTQSLVNQKAVVDAQTRQILAVEPNIHKATSTWSPHIGQNFTNVTDNMFMRWPWLYKYAIPKSTFNKDPSGKESGTLSVADLYLNQKLTLQQAGETVQRTVKLHDLENTLSSIIASMYWTLGNVPPQAILANADDGTIQIGTSDSDSDTPTLLRGNAEVTEVSTQGRLDSNMIATAGGLAASVALFLLSLRYSLLSKSHKPETDNLIDGTGVLQAIWLYRNHPELETQLNQVDNPTETNLRKAGMVRTRLVGVDRRRREGCESALSPPQTFTMSSLPSQSRSDSDQSSSMRDSDSAESSLLHSAVELFKMSRKAPKLKRFDSSRTLHFLSLVLHSLLVGIHLALLAIWARGLEHRITFSLDNQKIVDFFITAIANTFGTLYTAALVFVTQRLWTRRNLQADRTLTAMHDSAAAWTGIGSALSQLWFQRTTSGSVVGVVSVFLYLANILVLHITTPALFAFETFNSTWPVHVATRSLPTLDSFSQVNWTNPDNASDAVYVFSKSNYVTGSLYFLPSILGSNTSLGLKDGTLYDLVDGNSGVGNVTVDATGFNITCNYLRAVTINGTTGVPIHGISAGSGSKGHTVNLDGVPAYNLFPTQRGIICPLPDERRVPSGIPNFVDFYSTIPIMDSDNYLPEVTLDPPMNTFSDPVSSIQIFRCSQSLVNQKAVVDAQTRQILSVEPNIHKTTSTWSPHIGQNSTNATDNVFMQAWHWLYNYAIPESEFVIDPAGKNAGMNSGTLSVADLYLNQKLTLQRAGETVPRTVKLHELENTLSSIIASMYWTLGNIPPQAILVNADDGTIQLGTSDTDTDAPILLRGSAEVTEVSTRGRLDSDIIATAGGLAASVTLFLLSLRYSLFSKSHQYQTDNPIDGTGILQAIWLYRNHPELETQLDQVDTPTEANLREAGMDIGKKNRPMRTEAAPSQIGELGGPGTSFMERITRPHRTTRLSATVGGA